MTEDQAEDVIKRHSPGSLEWIRGMKHMITLESKRIEKLQDKFDKKTVEFDELSSLVDSKEKNIKLLEAHW